MMKISKFFSVALAVAGVIGLASPAVHANTYSSYLEYSAVGAWGANNTSNTPPYFGKVTLTEGGSGNGAYVDVLVDLYGPNNALTGFRFVDTGNATTHSPFGFNLSNPGSATITMLNSPWIVSAGSSFVNSPFGTFNKELDNSNNPGNGNNAGNGAPFAVASPLNFRVGSATGVTFLGTGDHFVSNSALFWFVADVVDGDGATGLIAARDLIPTSPIPEPETYAMLLAGLGLMGFVARRRKKGLTS